jgi:hypothetical protein
MATAKKIEADPPVDPEVVELRLTQKEANMLRNILGAIGGDDCSLGETSVRRLVDRIYSALFSVTSPGYKGLDWESRPRLKNQY